MRCAGSKNTSPCVSKGFLRRTIGYIRAVDDVSFVMKKGETLGVIGESGCGKTTLGRCVSWLYEPDGGEIVVRSGEREFRPGQIDREDNSEFRKIVQVIFQDPFFVPEPAHERAAQRGRTPARQQARQRP